MRLTTRTRLTTAATATALAGVAGIVLSASPAAAHTTLTSSDPAKGATVAAPAEIHLNYADPVRFPGVVVRDAQGGHHESGKPSAVDNHVVEKVAGTLAPGVYTVGWRVVAEDGHPVTGEFRFTVKDGGSASASAAPAAPATDQPAAQAEKQRSSAGWWWIGLVALILALAGGGVALARRRG